MRDWDLIQEIATKITKRDISFASDDVIGIFNDLLALSFVAHFRATQDDDNVRTDSLKIGNQPRQRVHIPNVDSESHNLRFVSEDCG